jgi:hypothetical protein
MAKMIDVTSTPTLRYAVFAWSNWLYVSSQCRQARKVYDEYRRPPWQMNASADFARDAVFLLEVALRFFIGFIIRGGFGWYRPKVCKGHFAGTCTLCVFPVDAQLQQRHDAVAGCMTDLTLVLRVARRLFCERASRAALSDRYLVIT